MTGRCSCCVQWQLLLSTAEWLIKSAFSVLWCGTFTQCNNVFLSAYVFTACKMTIHKRCEKNVAKNCGINTKDLAEKLKELGLFGKKVCYCHLVRKKCT